MYISYVYDVRKERAPEIPHFAKALSHATSVVKADLVQGGATTSRVNERYVFLWLPTALVGKSICYYFFDLTFGKMILSCLKSSIPAGFLKLNCHWSIFQKKLCILG